jgi:protein-S-isoprenylcysteine O-methyltransferase Ste14
MARWPSIARRIRVPLGFAFAVIYFWLARPTLKSLAIGSAVIAIGVVIRALASGHVRKNEQLTTSGPYAHTRNPLYLGSIILAIGFALAARNWWIGAGLALLFFLIYLPVIRSEEAFLRQRFPEFVRYEASVPQLLPRLRSFGDNSVTFSGELYWKHREYNAAVGSAAMLAALLVKLIWILR